MARILIVDDEEKILEIYKDVLRFEGHDVFVAKNATQATWEIICNQQIELVLLDINMPEINGKYVKEIIDEYDPELKVMISSVYPIDEQKKMVPSANDFFDKSQGVDVLLGKIANLLAPKNSVSSV